MADTLEIFGTEYTGVTGIIATNSNDTDLTYIRPQGTKSISANGTGIDVTEYASVNVAVPSEAPTLQTKSVSYTPTETAQSETVTADNGYDGLDEVSVSVGAISSTYVGSGIPQRTSFDLTTYEDEVTAPAGYYADSASISVAITTRATPTISVNGTGLITATVEQSAGWVHSGTETATQQLTTKSATTYNTSTSDQTIASGQYLTGTQTIKAVTVSGLSADKILSGTTVKVGDANDDDRIASVTGTVTFTTYYTGSSTPSSSTGSDGDIYLKVV